MVESKQIYNADFFTDLEEYFTEDEENPFLKAYAFARDEE